MVSGFLSVWRIFGHALFCVGREALEREAMGRFGKLFLYVCCGTFGEKEMLDALRGKNCTCQS